jgi:hypothetical protein
MYLAIYYAFSFFNIHFLSMDERGLFRQSQKAVLEAQLDKWFASENSDNEEWEQAKQRLAKLERMEKNLQDLLLEEEISKQDFKERRLRIQAERTNLKYLVDTIEPRWGLVRTDFEIGLQLANQLDSLFEKSNNDNRRLLCETVFKQVGVREGKIVDMEMNSPFTIIFSQAKGSESLLSGHQCRLIPLSLAFSPS